VYDAILVGAGHNGLVTAFYLARAGLRVLVLEARSLVGGSCITEELIPGFRFSTCANLVWSLRPQIIQDMQLYERGLIVDTRQFLRLLPDGRYLYSGRLNSLTPGAGAEAMQQEIAKFSPADAAAFPRWNEFWTRVSNIFGPYLLQPPPHLHEIYAGLTEAADKAVLDIVLTSSVAAIADQFFESELLRDMGAPADIGSIDDVGTGLLQSICYALGAYSETGEPVPNGYIRGGMGRLTELMAQAAQGHGVEIRTSTPVAKILVEQGRAIGVELVTGEQIRSHCVVSNLDPKRTLLQLVDAAELPLIFRQRVRAIRTAVGTCLKLHCALTEFPQYRMDGELTESQLHGATLIIAPNRAYRLAAWEPAARGELPTSPIIAAFIPNVYDPTLAPPGCYTWSAYIHWAPVQPHQGSWAELKPMMAERIFRLMDHYAPNFSRSVRDYILLTPADLQERMALTDGNIHHVDGNPNQLLWQRPLPELAHYATPLAQLYLCGAGMHPWGEVNGGPGYNAAQRILTGWAAGSSSRKSVGQ
jgi:phytoene dehydrogenase-like protein